MRPHATTTSTRPSSGLADYADLRDTTGYRVAGPQGNTPPAWQASSARGQIRLMSAAISDALPRRVRATIRRGVCSRDMRNVRVVSAALVALSLVGPTTADASRTVLKGNQAELTDGDGSRFAVTRPPGTVGIIDDQSGGRRDLPPGCSGGFPSIGWDIVFCGSQRGVVDLQTGAITPLHDLQPADLLGTAGATWVDGARQPSPSTSSELFINWRTGEQRELPYSPDDALRPRDLNAADFNRMKPLARGSLVLGRADGRWAIWGPVANLRLRYRGRTLRVSARCTGRGDSCSEAQYGAGILSWSEGSRACAFVGRTRRTGCFTPPRSLAKRLGGSWWGEPYITHTKAAVYANYRLESANSNFPLKRVGFRVPLRKLTAVRHH